MRYTNPRLLYFTLLYMTYIRMLPLHDMEEVAGVFSDSVSSADGVHTQRPLEQRSNARGTSVSSRSSGRSDRPARGRGHARDVPSNDRAKVSAQQPVSQSERIRVTKVTNVTARPLVSTPSPMSNDVSVQATAAAKPATISAGKEAGDSVKSTSEKPQTHSQSKPIAEPSVNSTETTGTEVTPSAVGD